MTGKQKIILILKDNKWHSYRELLETYYKFTQRIFDLRTDGFMIEERPNIKNKHACDYRLLPAQNPKSKQIGSSPIKDKVAARGCYAGNQHELFQSTPYTDY